MHQWELKVELLRITVCENVVLIVPFASFQVHSVDETTRLWFRVDFLPANVITNHIFEAELIDGDDVVTGIVLLRTSEEGLWEEESRDPVDCWSAVVVPILKESYSLNQICDP